MLPEDADALVLSPRRRAQELVYDAWEAPDRKTEVRLAREALRLDPRCVDALHILAEAPGRRDEEQIAELRRIVQIAEADLGVQGVKEWRGHFWGVLATRPYMRVRAHLGEVLRDTGRLREAIREFQGMLRLNPNDNQGVRYELLGCYLAEGRLANARGVLRRYGNESSAVFAWSEVLLRWLVSDEAGARRALVRARAINPSVAKYLTGRKKPPRHSPDLYSPGGESEAIICVHEIGLAWERHPDAVHWLRARLGGGPGGRRRR